MNTLLNQLKKIPRELAIFAIATLVLGMAYSMFDSTFNNFLNKEFALTPFQRSFLEFPRELPGFLVVFVSAVLWFLCSRRLGAVSLLLGAVGALLVGLASSSYYLMTFWMFVYSLGQHLYMPIASTIGMELAEEGKTGQRLGQLNSIRNLATVLGSLLIAVGFKYLGFAFKHSFILAGVALAVAAALLFSMHPEKTQRPKTFLTLHKEYNLYYLLGIISGARRQVFFTFAPWLLVSIFNQPTQIMATLYTIGGVIGILFQPFLGWTIDRLGERFVLASEAVILVFVCLGYAFARSLLPEGTALIVVCACFLVDQMVFSVAMARATYLKKIALHPGDVQPALTATVTIDHIFSIAAALIGGLIWNRFGFQYVFLMGVGIAVINFFTALRVRIPAPASIPPDK